MTTLHRHSTVSAQLEPPPSASTLAKQQLPDEPGRNEVDEDDVIRCMPVEARFIAVSLCHMQTRPDVAAKWLSSQAEAFGGALPRVLDALRQNRLNTLQPCDSAEYESLVSWWSTKRRQENVKELIVQLQSAMVQQKYRKARTNKT